MSTREITAMELGQAQRRAERYLKKNQRRRLLRARWMNLLGNGAVIAAGSFAVVMQVLRHVL